MDKIETVAENSHKIFISLAMSIGAYFVTLHLIPGLKEMFIKANLFGFDMNKKNSGKVPEAMGVVSGCIFLITLFLFIPIPFTAYIFETQQFPHSEFVEFLAALVSICCMVLLGFADDVLDLRWRHKLLLPLIASLPLIMVYFINFNSTTVIIPKPLRRWVGFSVDLGILYYIYMIMLSVFCTNAINILAGINGLEVGQSIVIAASIVVFNLIELFGDLWKAHVFSLYILLPYLSTSLALFKFNWYPSEVFVGDTFCYLSGMTFAVVGILGHFSKTILLFLIPQIINFLYSTPQLFHLVPCPRHRLPKYDGSIDKVHASVTVFHKSQLTSLGSLIIQILKTFKLATVEEDSEGIITCNNLTLINFVLIYLGPLKESVLTTILMFIQVLCTVLALVIRYPLASVFYDV